MHVLQHIGCLAILVMLTPMLAADAQWTQWGGPDRNFIVESGQLADSWPDDGPPRLWQRELGDGYSSILFDENVLYTMYRVDHVEFTIALDAATGKTIWEHRHPSPYTPHMADYGPGPHATPLIVGERLYSVGTNAMLHCFDKRTGKVLWKHDLLVEYGGEVPPYGYSCSPLAYKQTIIIPLGSFREVEQPLVAFDQATGNVVWKNKPYAGVVARQFEYSAPILINLDGQDQLVFLGSDRVAGYNPDTGRELWSHPHVHDNGINATTPVFNGKDLLFISAAYDSGARLLRLKRVGERTEVEELWYSRKMRMHHGNAIVVDDHVYGSSGDFGPAFLVAMNMTTGKPTWRKRGFSKASLVRADDKMILLDEDGRLALLDISSEGMKVLSQCKITERVSWTAPTLVDTMLYVRDRQHIMALDLK